MMTKWKEKMGHKATLGELIHLSRKNKWHKFIGDVDWDILSQLVSYKTSQEIVVRLLLDS